MEQEEFLEEDAPLRDWAFDLETKQFLRKGGRQYLEEGREALKNWIWKALKTPRDRYAAYSSEFGEEFDQIQGITDFDLIQEELERMITDALLVSPYINHVRGFSFEREGSVVYVHFTADTAFGELETETEVELDED